MKTMSLSCYGWIGSATFSDDGKYRYSLTRTWNDGEGICVFVMLNPSTATAEENDPTIRRCIGYARRWGYDTLRILNLFAFRATDPRELYKAADPVGPMNDETIVKQCGYAQKIVCAWGVHGDYKKRGIAVLKMISGMGLKPEALAETKVGIPKHPLYLKGDLVPYEMTGTRR